MSMKTAYRILNAYYQDNLHPEGFSVSYEDIDHEEHMALAETMLGELKDGIV